MTDKGAVTKKYLFLQLILVKMLQIQKAKKVIPIILMAQIG